MGGLPIADITKINQYGMPSDMQKELLDANDAGLAALQQRYAEPNWFNVAAGFFKPQLGGFSASLGSASQALGENLENRRANELPIAQMRAQNVIMRNQFGLNQKAADMVKAHETEGAPLHQLPDLVAKLTQLGSPLAAGPKARLDEARKSQDTMVQRAQLVRAQNEQEMAKINSDLVNKVITIAEAGKRRAALPPVPDVPDLFAVPKPSAGGETTLPAAADAAPPKPPELLDRNASAYSGTDTTPPPPAAAAVATDAATPVKKTLIKPVLDLGAETNKTEANIRARAETATMYAKEGNEVYGYLRSTAGPEAYNSTVAPIQNALGLLGYGVADPVKKAELEGNAKKVMNVLSGNAFNALLKSINTGVGGKIGDLYAQVNLPIEDFVRAKFPLDLQDYAKDLAQNLAQASLARQKLGGISPSAARNAELHLYGEASPTMGATPLSAMKNLMHLHTSYDQLRDMYNFVNQVDTGEHPDYEVDPANDVTRIYDILRSKGYTKIADDYGEKHRGIEKVSLKRK